MNRDDLKVISALAEANSPAAYGACDEKFNRNAAAISIAKILCDGKSKAEVAEIYQLINVVLCSVRSYL